LRRRRGNETGENGMPGLESKKAPAFETPARFLFPDLATEGGRRKQKKGGAGGGPPAVQGPAPMNGVFVTWFFATDGRASFAGSHHFAAPGSLGERLPGESDWPARARCGFFV